MSQLKIMAGRISVRTYSLEVPVDLLEKINKIVEKKRKGPFGNIFSFTLMDTKDKNIGKITSYGVIKGARLFFGGYSDPDDKSVVDYGYCFEAALLELTELNLGTCWLGGSFSRGFTQKVLSMPEGKVIPAISPVGISMENKSLADTLIRYIAGSAKRKPRNELFYKIPDKGMLSPQTKEDVSPRLDKILESIRCAPSASNKQPWRIVFQGEQIHFYWDFDKKYNLYFRGFNIQAIDMGIALCHFITASNELGYNGKLCDADPHLEDIPWKYVLSWIT